MTKENRNNAKLHAERVTNLQQWNRLIVLIMSKLNLIIIFLFCFISFTKCHINTNPDESKSIIVLNDSIIVLNDSITVLNDTVKKYKPQNTKYEGLIGRWFMPHNGTVNITFCENGTFGFNNYNIKTDKEEILRGTFELKGSKLILKYNDRPQQTFKYAKGKGADDNYYITKKGDYYYFVKSDVDDLDGFLPCE